MTTPMRVPCLGDNPADVELGRHVLRKAESRVDMAHVDHEIEFAARLSDDFDIIPADDSPPRFSALRALHVVQRRRPEATSIILSGTIGEAPGDQGLFSHRSENGLRSHEKMMARVRLGIGARE